jgi:hypothetical protein
MVLDQEIIRRATFVLGEFAPPFVRDGVGLRSRARSARLPSVTGSASSQNDACAMTPSNAGAGPAGV